VDPLNGARRLAAPNPGVDFPWGGIQPIPRPPRTLEAFKNMEGGPSEAGEGKNGRTGGGRHGAVPNRKEKLLGGQVKGAFCRVFGSSHHPQFGGLGGPSHSGKPFGAWEISDFLDVYVGSRAFHLFPLFQNDLAPATRGPGAGRSRSGMAVVPKQADRYPATEHPFVNVRTFRKTVLRAANKNHFALPLHGERDREIFSPQGAASAGRWVGRQTYGARVGSTKVRPLID